MMSLMTGRSTRRPLTTGTGLAAAPCTPNAAPTGTTTDYDQGIDIDDTMLNGGAPGADLPRAALPRLTRINCA